MKDYNWIYEHAVARKGGPEALQALLPEPKTAAELAKIGDDRYLSDLSRRVFRAGLKHSMVDARWPAFEEVFFSFNPNKLVLFSDEALERTLQDKRLIRHWGKIKSIRINALMVKEFSEAHAGFGRFLADWPADNIVGLWQVLAKQGQQLGGKSAPYFLRMVGKDTFLLTKDVVGALIAQGIVDRKVTSKSELAAVQEAFNQWQEQSGQPLCHISRMLAFCVD